VNSFNNNNELSNSNPSQRPDPHPEAKVISQGKPNNQEYRRGVGVSVGLESSFQSVGLGVSVVSCTPHSSACRLYLYMMYDVFSGEVLTVSVLSSDITKNKKSGIELRLSSISVLRLSNSN
jgi:hypothetical protein